MQLKEIFLKQQTTSELQTLVQHCSDFFNAAQGNPLLKNLPTEYNTFHKVKVRHKNHITEIGETFNKAFQNEVYKISQRAVFANGPSSFARSTNEKYEPYYIFPINGFKYMYCTEVQASTLQYKQTFDALFEKFGNDKGQAIEILKDLLKYTYTSETLIEGIESGAEIIIYNIPFFYAIKQAVVNDYNKLLTFVHQ